MSKSYLSIRYLREKMRRILKYGDATREKGNVNYHKASGNYHNDNVT